VSFPSGLADLTPRYWLARRVPPPAVLLPTLALLLAPALQPRRMAAQTLDPGELAERLRTEVEEAKIAGDADALRQIVILSRRAVTAFPEDGLLSHYAGYALYCLAGRTMETDMDASHALLEEAELFLERSVKVEPIAESYALLFSAIGMRIDGPVSAMSLGMQSGAARDRAKALGPRNPRVRLLEGVSAFHTPRAFGGGHEAALEHFLAAIELFAEDAPQPPLPAWGHAEAYAWLGQTHVALGQDEAARTAFERALELEPSYVWVREVLLPGLGGTHRLLRRLPGQSTAPCCVAVRHRSVPRPPRRRTAGTVPWSCCASAAPRKQTCAAPPCPRDSCTTSWTGTSNW